MPSIESLMQEWPPDVEETLKRSALPSADMEVELETYVDMVSAVAYMTRTTKVCSIVDIPVHKSRVEALHLLFSLYAEFRSSQHFRALADDNELKGHMDRIEL